MHTHSCALPDTRWAVHTAGVGPAMLLLHGFPLDHSMWDGQDPLADAVRLIVPDQRGFGASRGDGPASIAQMADDAVALLDCLHIHEPAIICGLSMGGYVAQHIAARHPSRVRSLILVDTKLEADTPQARALRGSLAAQALRLGPEVVAKAMIPNLLSQSAEALANPRRLSLEAALHRMIMAAAVPTIVAGLEALGDRPDMTEAMAHVAVPTLLVVGDDDSITPPECLARAAQVIPDSRLLIVPHCGHMVPMEAPDVFNAAVLDFLGVACHSA